MTRAIRAPYRQDFTYWDHSLGFFGTALNLASSPVTTR
jgi:hypothetical protein